MYKRQLDTVGLDAILRSMDQRGIESVAICLLHSYLNPAHEIALRDLIQQRRPGLSITLSSEVCPEIREFDRACTALANAYIRYHKHLRAIMYWLALLAKRITSPVVYLRVAHGP